MLKGIPARSLTIFALLIPLMFINIRSDHDWGGDFAQYIHQAKNITEGKPQHETGYMYNPHYKILAPKAYPPGFPLLLSPVVKLYGLNFSVFNRYLSLFLILTLVLFYIYLRKNFSFFSTVIMVLLLGYNPWVLSFKSESLSEIPFTAFLLAALLMYRHADNTNEKRWWWYGLTGLVAGFAMLIRTNGVAFPAALLLFALYQVLRGKNKWRSRLDHVKPELYVTASAVAVFFILKSILPTGVNEHQSYLQLYQSGNLVSTASANLSAYFNGLKAFFALPAGFWGFFLIALQSVFLSFSILGFLKRLLLRPTVTEFLTLSLLLIILAYPYTGGLRFLFPLLPFALYYTGLIAREVLGDLRQRFGRAVPVIISVLLLISYADGVENVLRGSRQVQWGPHHPAAMEAWTYLTKKIPSGSVVEYAKPRVLALFGGQKSFHINYEEPPAEIRRQLREFNAGYILIAKDPVKWYEPDNMKSILEDASTVTMVWENSKFQLFKILR